MSGPAMMFVALKESAAEK
jgi:hypothetical protein